MIQGPLVPGACVVKLDDGAAVTRHDYLDGSWCIVISVPCDNHCRTCECADHYARVPPDKAAELVRVIEGGSGA